MLPVPIVYHMWRLVAYIKQEVCLSQLQQDFQNAIEYNIYKHEKWQQRSMKTEAKGAKGVSAKDVCLFMLVVDEAYLCHITIGCNIDWNESRHTIHSIACFDNVGSVEHVPIHELIL